jgi:phage gpG-like protein
VKIRVTADTPDIQRLIERLRPEQVDGALKAVGEAGVSLVRDSFQRSEDPYGKAWQALSDKTLRRKVPGTNRVRSSYSDGRPLRRRGHLMSSFNARVSRGTVEIGTPMPHAKYHQGDDNHPSKGIIPRRMFLPVADRGLPKAWQEEITETIEAYLEE